MPAKFCRCRYRRSVGGSGIRHGRRNSRTLFRSSGFKSGQFLLPVVRAQCGSIVANAPEMQVIGLVAATTTRYLGTEYMRTVGAFAASVRRRRQNFGGWRCKNRRGAPNASDSGPDMAVDDI